MKLQQIQYFCAIAEEENMSAAARKLAVAQPVLSRSLSELEEELGVRLFDRAGKYLKLNDNGRFFARQTGYALHLVDDAVNRLREPEKYIEGEVTLCADALRPYTPRLAQRFHQCYPGLRLRMAISEDCAALRQKGEFDVAITYKPDPLYEKEQEILLREEFVLMVPEEHPLAAVGRVNLNALQKERFVFCCLASSELSRKYEALCRVAGFVPRVVLSGADLDATSTMVREEKCVAMILSTAMSILTAEQRRAVALVELVAPYFAQSVSLVTPIGREPTIAGGILQRFTREYCTKIFPEGVCGLNRKINYPPL